jgi:hypothetical protein
MDDEAWAIRYIEVATKNWWPGKKVLVSPAWIQRVSWIDSKVVVALSREGIQGAPEFVESSLITVSSLVRNVPMLNSLEMSPFSIFMTLDFHDVALGRGVMLCLWPSPERSPFRAKRRGRPETKLACSSARRPTEPPSRGPSLSIFPAMDGPASDARGGTLNFSSQRRCES